MIRLLEAPPAELLSRADKDIYSHLCDEQGLFKYPDLIPGEDFNFSNKTTFMDGQEKMLFIHFAKRMLAWAPEE
ncbi:hypothetical protein QQS21_000050 [Conoideocrella luteorostrata]|uniref:Uncharacterized protein n=1 Tax=Conoideocrella luteorostrata TaxID=1105319 RepID=A0AAJ0D1F0_9HYPO|nr:hypothetical protein QQS21_000050 [Conoideocrella luteorostrata]